MISEYLRKYFVFRTFRQLNGLNINNDRLNATKRSIIYEKIIKIKKKLTFYET